MSEEYDVYQMIVDLMDSEDGMSAVESLPPKKKKNRVRSYVCTFENCSKSFYDKSKLKRHFLVHPGVKTYQCPICNKASAYYSNLKTHIATHNNKMRVT